MPLTIHSASGGHRFTVEVAATPEQQERGLMFRRSLAADRGMIFPYDPPQDVAFWMKNTLIPLDMIFIRSDGTIARIANAEAARPDPLPSGEPVAAVLEIRGGRAAELGIKEGDMVELDALSLALASQRERGKGASPWVSGREHSPGGTGRRGARAVHSPLRQRGRPRRRRQHLLSGQEGPAPPLGDLHRRQ